MKLSSKRWFLAAGLALLTLGSSRAGAAIDPKATDQLRKMSDFLASQKKFAFRGESATEVVLKNGEKIELNNSSQVLVDRPNMMRSDRLGDSPESLYYDGRTMTLHGRSDNFYATTAAPPTLDQAIDFARDQLGVEAPAADLLNSHAYNVLMEDVVEATDLGMTTLNGVPSHHLAFRGTETDWQIWIADGPQPLPLKLVIVSKKVPGQPEFRVEASHWDLAPSFQASAFSFTPPAGAKRIDFLTPSGPTPGGKRP